MKVSSTLTSSMFMLYPSLFDMQFHIIECSLDYSFQHVKILIINSVQDNLEFDNDAEQDKPDSQHHKLQVFLNNIGKKTWTAGIQIFRDSSGLTSAQIFSLLSALFPNSTITNLLFCIFLLVLEVYYSRSLVSLQDISIRSLVSLLHQELVVSTFRKSKYSPESSLF